jgi:serine/threonine protein kinase
MSAKYFFESLDTSTSKALLWNAPNKPLDGKVIKSGSLLKHSLNATGESGLTERFFILQDGHLMYKKSECSQRVSAVMNIKYAKLVLPGNDGQEPMSQDLIENQKFWLKVCFKGKYSLLFAKSEIEYRDWIAAFTSVMTRNDIHQRFVVEKPIGAGAFAQVFKAQEKSTGNWYAVKAFSKNIVLEIPSGKKALWNEIEILRQVKGKPNMLNLYEVHETPNSVYLVTEYLEGGDLSQFISNNKLISEKDIICIMCGILKGLKNETFVHRDLKPANIMLRKTSKITSDDVVIVDFGLAVNMDDLHPVFKTCGTPGFMAPEVIHCKDKYTSFSIPRKCDVYGAGVIMYVLCTRQNLFDKSEYDENSILKKNLESKIEFPSQFFSKFSSEISAILKSMLKPDPEKRISMDDATTLIMNLQLIKCKTSSFVCKDSDESYLTRSLNCYLHDENLLKNTTFPQNPIKVYQIMISSNKTQDGITADQIMLNSPIFSDYEKDKSATGFKKMEVSPGVNSPSAPNQDSKLKPYTEDSFYRQSTLDSPHLLMRPIRRKAMVVNIKNSSYFEPSATILPSQL